LQASVTIIDFHGKTGYYQADTAKSGVLDMDATEWAQSPVQFGRGVMTFSPDKGAQLIEVATVLIFKWDFGFVLSLFRS